MMTKSSRLDHAAKPPGVLEPDLRVILVRTTLLSVGH